MFRKQHYMIEQMLLTREGPKIYTNPDFFRQ